MKTLLPPPLADDAPASLEKKTTGSNDTTKLTIKTPHGLQEFYFQGKLSAYEKTQIIKYLSTHEITQGGVTPNAYECGTKTTHAWEYQDEYKSVTNKYLGIWTNIVPYATLHSTYGFTMIFLSGISTNAPEISAAHTAGFRYDSMMVSLSYGSYANTLNKVKDAGFHVGYYFVDEPGEHSWTYPEVVNVSDSVNVLDPSAKFMFSSYTYPDCGWPLPDNTFYYLNIFNATSNAYIMCDQYRGDCCGFTDDYWTAFRNTYGLSRCISNWVHLIENNGGSSRYVCPGASNNFYDLLGDANESGTNRIWLYALSSTGGNENDIKYFCEQAWERGWLLRKKTYVTIYWRCHYQNPCENCDPTLPDGWYIDDFIYGSSVYVAY